MQTVAIIGAGEVGASTARVLASLECAGEIRLIDANGPVAAGKALDVLQCGPIEGFDVRLSGASELDAAAGASVLVVADRAGTEGEWHGEPGLELIRRVTRLAPDAPLVFAGAHQRELLSTAAREQRIPRHQLIGSAPGALVSAARAVVAVAAACSAADVSLAVVGMPGAWVIPWSECTVSGAPLTASLPAHAIARMERHAHASWPPGPHALGSAAARVVQAILSSSRRRLTVFTTLEGEYDARGAVAAVPVTLGPMGLRGLHPPILNTRERVTLDTALWRSSAP